MRYVVIALALVLSCQVAHASHGRGTSPDRYTCNIPNLPPPTTGFAAINPDLGGGTFLYKGFKIRSYTSFATQAGDDIHLYTSFGSGWCLGQTFDDELRRPNYDYVKCWIPGYVNEDLPAGSPFIDVGPSYVRVRERNTDYGTDGARSISFPFGHGYCFAGKYAEPTPEPTATPDIVIPLPSPTSGPPCEGTPCVED